MHQRRTWLLSFLLIAVLILAGCAPRASGGQTAEAAAASGIAIDLPALVIDLDANGTPSIAGTPLAELAGQLSLPDAVVGALAMDAAQVATMTQNNIQHIQIENTPNGLRVLVNGLSLPSLRWDGDTLSGTAQTLSALGLGVPGLEELLPTLTNLGFGFIIRFPVAEGVAAIPTHFEEPSESVVAARAAQDAFVEAAGGAPKINLPVVYDVDGRWRVGDLTDDEWTNLTGMPWTYLRLRPEVVTGLMRANITEMTVSTDAEGIHISLNGNPLPYIGWGDGELINALDLAEQMGLWNTLADSGMNMAEVVTMVETLLPAVQASEANFQIYLPSSVAVAR